MSIDVSDIDVGALYRTVRVRLAELVADVPAPDTIAVPACPGWSVKDVLAHVAAIAEDVVAGRLAGPPDDDVTAAQVAARRGTPMVDVLADWAVRAPAFEHLVRRGRMWPALLDVLSHEHDVRGALGRPAGRHAPELLLGAELLVSVLRPPTAMTVRVGERDLRVGPTDRPCGLALSTTHFEAFRFRMGRRSRAQLAAMAWTGDPTPVLDRLTVFGPASSDVIE